MHIGIRVRQERERLGLSREALVQQMPEALRMDRNTLWHIEAGRTKNPRADQLMALAHVLGVSTDYLLGLSDGPQARKRRARSTDARPPVPIGDVAPARLTPGLWKGQVWIAPDFDETDEDLIRAFEGEDGS